MRSELFFWATPHGMWDLNQGLNRCPLPWKRGLLTTGPPGNSWEIRTFW